MFNELLNGRLYIPSKNEVIRKSRKSSKTAKHISRKSKMSRKNKKKVDRSDSEDGEEQAAERKQSEEPSSEAELGDVPGGEEVSDTMKLEYDQANTTHYEDKVTTSNIESSAMSQASNAASSMVSQHHN
ncbi:unnamed protein product [Caenorhabditis nigoni]